MGQLNHEPSMEDILASIKRIIAEDSEAVGARPPRLRREAMTAVASSPLVVPREEPAPPPVEEPEALAPDVAASQDAPEPNDAPEAPHDVLELTSPMTDVATAETAPSTPPAAPAIGLDSLISSPAAMASRNAFAALNQLQVRAETGQENTLEGLVADLLRPMLREWLDRELPALVERLVSAEVSRLSGRG